MLGETAGHSSKNRYCPARFGTVDRYEAMGPTSSMIPHARVFKYSACAHKRTVGRDRQSMSKGEATSGLL